MKMMSTLILTIIAVVILAYLFFSYGATLLAPVLKIKSATVCIKGTCFDAEVAQTTRQREIGLMNRSTLEKNKGMFFIFDKEGIYSFWMKNTLIPLDIIWINENNKIVYISAETKPCKSIICPQVTPDQKAKYVLEIGAGLSGEAGFNIGDNVDIKFNYF